MYIYINAYNTYSDVRTLEQLMFSLKSHIATYLGSACFFFSTWRAYMDNIIPARLTRMCSTVKDEGKDIVTKLLSLFFRHTFQLNNDVTAAEMKEILVLDLNDNNK